MTSFYHVSIGIGDVGVPHHDIKNRAKHCLSKAKRKTGVSLLFGIDTIKKVARFATVLIPEIAVQQVVWNFLVKLKKKIV